MDDFVLMGVLERLDYLVDIVGGPGLWELLLVLQNLVQLAIRRVVQNDVDALVIEEEPVHG